MNLIGVAARTLLVALLADLTNGTLRRGLSIGLLWFGALGTSLLAVVFAALAAHIALSAALSPAAAAAIVAGGLALLAAIAGLAAWLATGRRDAGPADHRQAAAPAAGQADLLQLALTAGMLAGGTLFGHRKDH